VNEELQAQVE